MKQIHGGNIQKAKTLYNLKESEILDFSANINFLGPAPGLIDKLKNSMERVIHYPEPHSIRFLKELAAFLNIKAEYLIVSNGAVELIYQLINRMKPNKTLIPVPSFSEYEYAVKSIGGKIEYCYSDKKNGFKIDLDKIIASLGRVDLLFLCNPNNPTGTLIEADRIKILLEHAYSEDVFVVIDEAFIDFVINKDRYSVFDLVSNYNNLFILRSMTKFYAIPGLRLGYGIANPSLINLLKKNRDPWSVNSLAQIAGEFVLNKDDYCQQTIAENRIAREYLFNELKKIKGLNPFKPTANYIFIDISQTAYSASKLTDILAKNKILIRNCSSYHGLDENYIRVAVKSRRSNEKLLNVLKSII